MYDDDQDPPRQYFGQENGMMPDGENDTPQPGVSRALEMLYMEVERFEKLAQSFDQHLDPVLRPEEPQKDPSGLVGGRELSSQLAARISSLTTSLRETGARMDRILRRIDV